MTDPYEDCEPSVRELAMSEAKEKLKKRMEECGGDPSRALTQDYLFANPDVLWTEARLGLDFDAEAWRLYREQPSVETFAIDTDTTDLWAAKGAGTWQSADDQYKDSNALLLCMTENRTGVDPAGHGRLIFSGVVVWVCTDQHLVYVHEAVAHLQKEAAEGRECVALCRIPTPNPPYWPYPARGDPSFFILSSLQREPLSMWSGAPETFRAWETIPFIRTDLKRFVVLDRQVTRSLGSHQDEVVFRRVDSCKDMWVNTAFVIYGTEGGAVPAKNIVYMAGSGDIEKRPSSFNASLQGVHFTPNKDIAWVNFPGGDPQPDPAKTPEAPPPPLGTDHITPGPEPLPPAPKEPQPEIQVKLEVPDEPDDKAGEPDEVEHAADEENPDRPADVVSDSAASVASARQRAGDTVQRRLIRILAQTKKLHKTYAELAEFYYCRLEVLHEDIMLGLSTCTSAIRRAMNTFRLDVDTQRGQLGAQPSLGDYNRAVDHVRLAAQTLQASVNDAELEYLDHRRRTRDNQQKVLDETREYLTKEGNSAVTKFLKAATPLAQKAGDADGGESAPFTALLAQQAGDFLGRVEGLWTANLDFEINTRFLTAVNQLDILATHARAMPMMCPLYFASAGTPAAVPSGSHAPAVPTSSARTAPSPAKAAKPTPPPKQSAVVHPERSRAPPAPTPQRAPGLQLFQDTPKTRPAPAPGPAPTQKRALSVPEKPTYKVDDDDCILLDLIDEGESSESSPAKNPKKPRVEQPPGKPKLQVEQKAASFGLDAVKDSLADADNILGTLSDSDSDESIATPVKPGKKKMTKKKKKETDRAGPEESSESERDRPAHKGKSKLTEAEEIMQTNSMIDAEKMRLRALARDSDFGYISALRQKYNLPDSVPTQRDLSSLMDVIQQHNVQMGMTDKEWYALYPTVKSSRKVFRNMSRKEDILPSERQKHADAYAQLDDPKSLRLPISRGVAGKPEAVVATRLARVFVNDSGVVSVPLKGIAAKQSMFGLTKLHRPEAISRREKTIKPFGKPVKVLSKSQCPVCSYVTDNHDSINNHIRAHWRLALLCGICLRIYPTASAMTSHGRDEHHLVFRDAEK